MGDIITTLSKIGTHYLEDEKRVKNKAYEYTKIKVYLFDTVTKKIEVSLNIKSEDLIITRFGVGANSGNLFPNMFFEPKNVKKEFDKFVRGVLKGNKNLLSYFTDEEIENNDKLKILNAIDESCFSEKVEEIQKLDKYQKSKGEKGKFATYFSLSYNEEPISAYFKDIYEKHLNKSDVKTVYGYDIINNEQGVGSDANLAFCSVNELPKKLQTVKPRLLPLSFSNAKRVKIGFDATDKMLSHNFYGLKMAIMPTILGFDETVYGEVLEILEESSKGRISEIEESETNINEYLEDVAYREKGLPVLNTILFYQKNNAAIDVLLQIDDVLPSYISNVSDKMGFFNIKAFKDKDIKDSEETIYLQKIIDERLDIMNLLLSAKKIHKDSLIEKFSQLIYWGNSNMKYAYPVDWEKYFNGFYKERKIEVLSRYLSFFNSIDKVKEKFILQEEIELEEIYENDSSKVKQEKRVKNIDESFKQSVFVQQNEILKTAYLLGMYSQALINWQKGVNQSNNSSYAKWLNGSRAIKQSGLDRIWDKADEALHKIESTSKSGNTTVNYVKEILLEYMPKFMMSKEIAKSSEVSLAFAMGGSDYFKSTKEKKNKED